MRKQNNDVLFEDVMKEVSSLCDRYGYTCFQRFDEIHIVTRCEAWYFVPRTDDIIKLMHGNQLGQKPNGYHKQFSRKMNYKELFVYITEHAQGKYSGSRPLQFSFTKTGAKKRGVCYNF